MPFPVHSETGGTNSAAISQTLTMPSIATGDLVIAYCRNFSTTAQNSWTYNGSTTSFTQLVNTTGGISSHRVVMKYRIIQAGDTGDITVAMASSTAVEYSIVKVSAGTWHGTTAPEWQQSNNTTTSTGDLPALTPSWGTDETLWLGISTTAGSSINNNLANYTSYTQYSSTQRTLYRVLMAESQDPGTITSAGTTHFINFTVAVRPLYVATRQVHLIGM